MNEPLFQRMKGTFKSVVLNCLGLPFSLYSSAALHKTINRDEPSHWMGDIRAECRLWDGKSCLRGHTHTHTLRAFGITALWSFFFTLSVGIGLETLRWTSLCITYVCVCVCAQL